MSESSSPPPTGEPSAATADSPSPRRGAVWPWLVMPVIALSAYFALRSCHAEVGRGAGDGGPSDTVPPYSGTVTGL